MLSRVKPTAPTDPQPGGAVLHAAVAAWLVGPEPSGANRRLLALLGAASSHLLEGERITVLCSAEGPRLNSGPRVDVVTVPIPARPTWRRVLAERRVLPQALADLGATVIDLGSLPVPARLPCPVALTIHDLRDLSSFRRRPRSLTRALLKRSVARAQQVIVPSEFTAAALDDAIPNHQAQVTVVPGGVDDGFYRRILTAPEQPFFLHVGHLERRKNLDLLLRAYARFVEQRNGTDAASTPALVLAGADQGQGRPLRRLAAALGVGARVRFAEAVTDDVLLDLYGRASAVVFPSLYEGFGMPALEALAMGKPLLVSDHGALPEVVGDAARVVNGHDLEAWTAALREVWEVPMSEADGQHRRLRARSFRWDAAAARVLQVWRAASAAR